MKEPDTQNRKNENKKLITSTLSIVILMSGFLTAGCAETATRDVTLRAVLEKENARNVMP